MASHEGAHRLVRRGTPVHDEARLLGADHAAQREAELLTHDVVEEEVGGAVHECHQVHHITPLHVALSVGEKCGG